MISFQKKNFWLILIIIFLPLIIISVRNDIRGQNKKINREKIRATKRPYGLTFDGSNFWYTDPAQRRIFRVTLSGKTSSFFVGNVRVYGIRFNPGNGLLYLGSEYRIIRINPITGGIHDILSVPVKRVAGIAFGPDFLYLLEKGTGNIHYYNQGLRRNIDVLRTNNPNLRDISLNHESIWLTDGTSGIIYRYNIVTKHFTGSLKAPVKSLRGLTFKGAQLWIIERNKNGGFIRRLPFAEKEEYILSGEIKYDVTVRISFLLNQRLSGYLIVLQPPGTIAQRPGKIISRDKQWKNNKFLISGERVFSKKIITRGHGFKRHTFVYRYRITTHNVRFYIPPDYRPGIEKLETSPAFYFTTGSEKEFNKPAPFDRLLHFLQKRDFVAQQSRGALPLYRFFQHQRLSARWFIRARISKKQTGIIREVGTEVYLRNFGWIPLPIAAINTGTQNDPRTFAYNANSIEICRMPDIRARGIGMIFHIRAKQILDTREMKAIKSRLIINIKKRAR